MRASLISTLLIVFVAACGLASGTSAMAWQAAAPPESAKQDTADAFPLVEGFGNYHRKITSTQPEAQRWFDQGIQLLYGYNHDEAIRSFERAAQIDPDCAMAWWGIAYANGFHINNPEMTEEQSRAAYEAAQKALTVLNNETDAERALVNAVAARYAWPVPEDRRPLDEAYAAAMEKGYRAHPLDADMGALFAESLMDLQPWDLWTTDGQPKARALEIVAALEHVLAIAPDHPGANHFYIHAVEASPWPGQATAAADRLAGLVPGSGHLVHMPSHIYIRTGRYAASSESNAAAIAADEKYFSEAPKPKFYFFYYLHNLHMLAYSAMMEGRYQASIEAARKIDSAVPPEFLAEYAKLADGLAPVTLHVLIRFGRWEDILQEPEPAEFRLVSRAIWRYARGVALAALDRLPEAHKELAAFDDMVAQIDDEWFVGHNTAPSVLKIARLMLTGEMAWREGRREEAYTLLREAIALEDQLAYDEPPDWMQPVRHALGALLIADNRAEEAIEAYREDLRRNPNNGWSMVGLRQALAKVGRTDEVAEISRALETTWARADVTPDASCYCQPPTGK